MKKQLYFMNNQNGFFLPYVLFITSLVFILATSHIATYRSDLQITENQIEQLRIETLFQMGRTKFKNEVYKGKFDGSNNKVFYLFPDGSVEILIKAFDNEQFALFFTIFTNKRSGHKVNNLLQIGEVIE